MHMLPGKIHSYTARVGRLAVALLALSVVTPRAAVWHVDVNTGDNGNDGLSAPFETIQHALNQASPGDTVLVAPGVYHENIRIPHGGSSGHPLLLKAAADGLYQTVITGAAPDVRKGAVSWESDPAHPGLYSIPLDHRPVRILANRIDLLPYQTPEDLLAAKFVKDDYPANDSGFAWDSGNKRLLVRLCPDGTHGTTNPNNAIMSVAPPTAGGKFGSTPNRPDNFLVSIPFKGSAWIVIEGFTFETPGLSAIYSEADDVIVRDCWFFGCRYGVMGSEQGDTHRILIEHCFYTQYPAFTDIVRVITRNVESQRAKKEWWQRIMHWQRKGGLPPASRGIGSDYSFETGLVRRAGIQWTIRANWLWEVFEGFSSGSVSLSQNLQITHNRIERVCDNAFESEEHARELTIAHNLVTDAFEAFSWQPLNGFPFPGPVYIHDNILLQTPDATLLWQTAGNNGGAFKLGAKDDRNWEKGGEGMTPKDVTRAPGGFWVVHNTVISPHGRMITSLNPPGRRYEGFFFVNNLVATATFSQSTSAAWSAPDILFAHNAIHFTTGPEQDRSTAAGTGGLSDFSTKQIPLTPAIIGARAFNYPSPLLQAGLTSHSIPLPDGTNLLIPSQLPLRRAVGSAPFQDIAGPRSRRDAQAWIKDLNLNRHLLQ